MKLIRALSPIVLFVGCFPMDHAQYDIGDALRKSTPPTDTICIEMGWYGVIKTKPGIHIHCVHNPKP